MDVSQDVSVQATTDDAIVSKYSAHFFGYFNDPYIKYFVKKPQKRSPLINRGYYARLAGVRKVVRRFFKVFPSGQMVNFGAGLDSLFFWLSDFCPDVSHFEIDFPEVAERKTQIITRHPQLLAKIRGAEKDLNASEFPHGNSGTSGSTLSIVHLDLRDVSKLSGVLATKGFCFRTPTLFLAECVLVYLKPDNANAVIKWAANAVQAPSCMVTYEQCNPSDAFGLTMVRNLSARGCPLLGISDYPTIESQTERYEKFGWHESSILDMNNVYDTYIDTADVLRVQGLEIFDEIEEWRLIQNHYFMLVAINKHWGVQACPVAHFFLSKYDEKSSCKPSVEVSYVALEN